MGIVCNQDYNNDAAAQSLASGVLSPLYGEEKEKLYYYVHDDEARIGWLVEMSQDMHTFERYSDASDADDHLSNFTEYLHDIAWFLTEHQDTVPNDDVVGQLLPAGYPLYDYWFNDADGIRLRVEVVARFKRDEYSSDFESQQFAHPPRYVVLVTHHDGKELGDSEYFRTIPTEGLIHIRYDAR